MIVELILISISLLISIYAIIYVSKNRENFGTKLKSLLLILIYLIGGIFYITIYTLHSMIYFSKDTALTLWRITMILRIPAMTLLISQRIPILKSRNEKIIYVFLLFFLGGIIVGLIFIPNSFEVIEIGGFYIFIIKNSYFLIFNLLYDIFLIILMTYILIRSYFNIKDKMFNIALSFESIVIAFLILTSTIYLFTQNFLSRYFHLIGYLFFCAIMIYFIMKKPEFFVDFLNKIYNFIIFHRSGILLYNYYGNEAEDSLLKGSILIGINHILLNFINKKDQLNLISLRNRHDIVLEYDNELNYAILLIVKRKDSFIDKAVQLFMNKFSKLYKDKLINLNGLIDTSSFKNTGEIISEYFSQYLR